MAPTNWNKSNFLSLIAVCLGEKKLKLLLFSPPTQVFFISHRRCFSSSSWEKIYLMFTLGLKPKTFQTLGIFIMTGISSDYFLFFVCLVEQLRNNSMSWLSTALKFYYLFALFFSSADKIIFILLTFVPSINLFKLFFTFFYPFVGTWTSKIKFFLFE